MTDLSVEVVGEGDDVVLVHGSGSRDRTWSEQLPLAARYRLVLPFRRGYGDSPSADPDFEVDGRDVAGLIDGQAHLVGFSYGAIGSMLAAARRPEAVRSLTVIEPPAFGLARHAPPVRELVERLARVFARAGELTPEEFDAEFDAGLGKEPSSEELDPAQRAAVQSLQRERPPYEAEIPFERLGGIRTLVVSGGWHPAFDAVCDVLQERLGAERAVVSGKGHAAQRAPGFNERLVAFWEVG